MQIADKTDNEVMMDSQKCLVVLFKPQIALALIEEYPGEKFVLAQTCYREIPCQELLSGHIGPYDWLRQPNGKIVGARFFPLDEAVSFLEDYVSQFSYVRTQGGHVEIYFSDHQDFEEDLSSDQGFGRNSVYSSNAGEYAITFGTDWLSKRELNSILALDANWIT